MNSQIKNRTARLVFLFVFSLGGLLLAALPGTVSGQTSTNPGNDPACDVNGAFAYCSYPIGSRTEERVKTSTSACTIGWSHRAATQEVTTTTVWEIQTLRVEVWEFVEYPLPIPGGEWFYIRQYQDSHEFVVSQSAEVGKCHPVTGRPPQN